MGLCIFLVFDWGVFQFARREREHMERLSDRNSGNLGTDLFGEKDTLLDGLGREVRPIGRDQDVLEFVVVGWTDPEGDRPYLGSALSLSAALRPRFRP